MSVIVSSIVRKAILIGIKYLNFIHLNVAPEGGETLKDLTVG
jgi:hypothetical protein